MFDDLGWLPLSQEARLILFYKIINGLEEVLSIKGILIANSHFRLRHFALGVSDWSLQIIFLGSITNSKTYKIS